MRKQRLEALGQWLLEQKTAIDGLADLEDPEAVHRARVGVRRLIAAIRIIPAVDAGVVEGARELMELLGPLRDIQVMHDTVCGWAQGGELVEPAALEPWLGELDRGRRETQARVHSFISSQEFLGWRAVLAALVPKDAKSPRSRVQSRYEDFALAAKGEDLHALRLATKKLRYAAGLCDRIRERETGYPHDLAALQDALGRAHDSQVAIEKLRSWAGTQAPEAALAAGALAQRYLAESSITATFAPLLLQGALGTGWKRYRKAHGL